MRSTQRVSAVVAAFVTLAVTPVAAQDEAALKSFFEGRRVTVHIDMPGTQEGVNVSAERHGEMDLRDYRQNMTQFPTAIRAGDPVVVTLVKVKKDLIEFQLGGGGFGTFGDDTSTDVYMPLVDKSDREKDLERAIRNEDDERERRRMQRQLDELRDRREHENHRIMEERERRSAIKAQQVLENRMRGGSRFNIRFEHVVPPDFTPERLMASLAEYVDFGPLDPSMRRSEMAPPPLPPPPADITALRKGMTRAEAEEMFGRPAEINDHRDGSMVITTLIFLSGDQRIAADFVEGVLVRYTITSK